MSRTQRELVVATGNQHKQREFARLLGADFHVLGLQDLSPRPGHAEGPGDVEETGDSFAANAEIKALHASLFTCHAVLADDSGLCVDALDGGPGIRSARHGGPGLSDQERYEKVLDSLGDLESTRRGAHYEASIALALEGRLLCVRSGRCEGSILSRPRGKGGFGYDPIFWVPAYELAMAELSPSQKDAVSHRARALTALAGDLAKLP